MSSSVVLQLAGGRLPTGSSAAASPRWGWRGTAGREACAALEWPSGCRRFSLSPRERAGVRGMRFSFLQCRSFRMSPKVRCGGVEAEACPEKMQGETPNGCQNSSGRRGEESKLEKSWGRREPTAVVVGKQGAVCGGAASDRPGEFRRPADRTGPVGPRQQPGTRGGPASVGPVPDAGSPAGAAGDPLAVDRRVEPRVGCP